MLFGRERPGISVSASPSPRGRGPALGSRCSQRSATPQPWNLGLSGFVQRSIYSIEKEVIKETQMTSSFCKNFSLIRPRLSLWLPQLPPAPRRERRAGGVVREAPRPPKAPPGSGPWRHCLRPRSQRRCQRWGPPGSCARALR